MSNLRSRKYRNAAFVSLVLFALDCAFVIAVDSIGLTLLGSMAAIVLFVITIYHLTVWRLLVSLPVVSTYSAPESLQMDKAEDPAA